jgi:hypothetical protein
MYGATFDFIAARAARYPVTVKRTQVRTMRKVFSHTVETGDPAIRWLLLNTQRTNRLLMGTG